MNMISWMDDRPVIVSVYCITYNHRPYIEAALDGILSQKTSFRFEVLVHDDASTDGTGDVVNEYALRYPGTVRAVIEAENQYSKGIHIARDILNPISKGSYIALCEGDDCWTDPLKLQKQYDALRNHPECDICTHRALAVRNGRQSGFIAPAARSRVIPCSRVIEGGGAFVATASIFCRREAYTALTPIRSVAALDYAVQIQCSLRGGMVYLDDCMCIYRQYLPGSWSVNHPGGLDPLIGDRLLDAVDSYTGGRWHASVERRRKLDRVKLMSGRGEHMRFFLFHASRPGFVLFRLGRQLNRLRVKLILRFRKR